MRQLKTMHRFFVSQSLYFVVLSSMFAMTLFVARVIYAHYVSYNFLPWNLFLAWVPYVFSLAAILLYLRSPRSWWLLLFPGAFWLIFFPNAPYIVTDFLHLEPLPRIPFWYDILMLASFAWTGLFLAIASLRTMQYLVQRYLGEVISWLFVTTTIALSGLGIYLGRFERWNSWDLFTRPGRILRDILFHALNPFNSLRFFTFTFMFAIFLFILYLMFATHIHIEELETEKNPAN